MSYFIIIWSDKTSTVYIRINNIFHLEWWPAGWRWRRRRMWCQREFGTPRTGHRPLARSRHQYHPQLALRCAGGTRNTERKTQTKTTQLLWIFFQISPPGLDFHMVTLACDECTHFILVNRFDQILLTYATIWNSKWPLLLLKTRQLLPLKFHQTDSIPIKHAWM